MRFALITTLLVFAAGQTPEEKKLVDFPELAKAFVARHCDPKASAPCKLEEVLARDYVRLPIGPFDLEIPNSMVSDKPGLENLRNIAVALSLAVNTWAEWQNAQSSFSPEMIGAMPAWSAHWKPVNEATIKRAKSRDLTDVMPTTDAERALVKSIEEACDKADKFALIVPESRQLRLILAPTRLDFMQWNGYTGLFDEKLKGVNWFDDAAQWMQFWIGWDLVIALEYASWNGFDPSFKEAQPMKKVGPGVMAQHVVQQATYGLLRACRPTMPESRYESALAMVMTIEACEEVDTIEGAGGVTTSGAKTKPYSRFIPGGNSKGGTLPGRSSAGLSSIVESRWRKGHGKDGFVQVLKTGMAEAVKAAKGTKGMEAIDPIATFVMHQEDNSGAHFVHAPFFGPHADEQEYPPGDYIVDFAEFFRAYKTGFFYWLEHEGIDPKEPSKKWNELVRGLSTVDDKVSFDDLVLKTYGIPVSGKDGKEDSLEWRFLKSLASAKPVKN
ncbi:MAG: hypothetical protein ABI054_09175 [Planctomycetota bacterium]